MSSTVLKSVAPALGYDAVEQMLADGYPLAACLAFAARAHSESPVGDESAPESAPTVLASDTPTIVAAA